jgi:hypothetical protein
MYIEHEVSQIVCEISQIAGVKLEEKRTYSNGAKIHYYHSRAIS